MGRFVWQIRSGVFVVQTNPPYTVFCKPGLHHMPLRRETWFVSFTFYCTVWNSSQGCAQRAVSAANKTMSIANVGHCVNGTIVRHANLDGVSSLIFRNQSNIVKADMAMGDACESGMTCHPAWPMNIHPPTQHFSLPRLTTPDARLSSKKKTNKPTQCGSMDER